MVRILMLCVMVFAHVLECAADGRPVGRNCNLPSPPRGSGEEFSHGATLKTFPRARDIGSNYTGCQITWAPEGRKWEILSVTQIDGGDPVRIWTPLNVDTVPYSCTYKNGKVVTGNALNCVAAEYLIKQSMAPGCVAKLMKSPGDWPKECGYE
jgi:hypothetical protein